jgi:hypothetical protein
MLAVPRPRRKSILHVLAALLGVLALAAPAAAQTAPAPAPVTPLPVTAGPEGTAFDGNGMWIWMLSQSSGGRPSAIAARARRAGVTTVFVKSSDGTGAWSQFSSSLVRSLHARGLKVCGWGYVYGSRPTAEARAARTAIRRGADCFVIDAESEYEGRYASAATYMRKLRAYAGPDYPIGVAPFPYVDYHPGYPYSVFLGPGGAQFNLPQMYWRAIGTSVSNVYAHSYSYGSLYGRPIYPLGQTYGGVSRRDVIRFREYAQAYGAPGVSWWSWQATPSSGWSALVAELRVLPASRAALPQPATLAKGARGDLVVWAQQHLLALGQKVKLNGKFDGTTRRAVIAVQRSAALPVTGLLDPATWHLLLAQPAVKVRWSSRGAATAARAGSYPEPASARLKPRRNELRRAPRR